jgi:hypothetical protein
MARSYHEQRQFGRRQTLIHAIVATPNGRRQSCIVRNVSQGGALLELSDPHKLPVHFKLVVGADRFEAKCEIRHRTANAVEVLFKSIRLGRGGRDTRDAAPCLEGVRQASPVMTAEPGRPSPPSRPSLASAIARPA